MRCPVATRPLAAPGSDICSTVMGGGYFTSDGHGVRVLLIQGSPLGLHRFQQQTLALVEASPEDTGIRQVVLRLEGSLMFLSGRSLGALNKLTVEWICRLEPRLVPVQVSERVYGGQRVGMVVPDGPSICVNRLDDDSAL